MELEGKVMNSKEAFADYNIKLKADEKPAKSIANERNGLESHLQQSQCGTGQSG